MPGEVEAEHFLLAGEQLLARPLRHLQRRIAHGRGWSCTGARQRLEERTLPFLAIALAPLSRFHSLIEPGEEPGPGAAERVERAGFDEALHDAPVDEPKVHAYAEVAEGPE